MAQVECCSVTSLRNVKEQESRTVVSFCGLLFFFSFFKFQLNILGCVILLADMSK